MELPTSDIHKMTVEEFDTAKLLINAARQRDERKYHQFPIIDIDCHHYENESMAEIVQFIEDPVIRHTGLVYSGKGTGAQTPLLPGVVGYQDMAGRVTRYPLRKTERTPADGKHRDVHLSLKWMDAMGVDYACLFPTPMLLLGLHPQAEVEVAMSRAYNRWLIEKIMADEPRIKTMLYLPFNDPEATYKMVKDFGDKKGVCGFMVVSTRYKPVHDNAYMKTYRLIEEMGKPLSFHASYNWNDQMLSNTNRFLVAHALGFTFFNVVHCANWIVNALPERFPKLKVVWIESGLAWIPWLMQRLDNDYKMRSSEAPGLKKLPSEYMQDMFYTNQPMEMPSDMSVLECTFKMIKAETQLLWCSDYPHWDMDLPSVIYDLPFLDEKAKRNILGENSRKLFDIDVSARYPNYKPMT
ncbi:MAG: amidohydrolase [Alphaproteobacteria bacterium]|nr:amidohydrolase [Alphaproteobacteria bacterium]